MLKTNKEATALDSNVFHEVLGSDQSSSAADYSIRCVQRFEEIGVSLHDKKHHESKAESHSTDPWEFASKYSKKEIQKMKASSELLIRKAGIPEEEIDCMALFDFKEVNLGQLLGRGEFSNVYKIESFRLQQSKEEEKKGGELLSREEHARVFLTQHAKRETTGNSRYAIKFLRPDLDKAIYTAAKDLALEAQFLSSLEHPNILKVRGWAADGLDGFSTGGNHGYFLILDCLHETLESRLRKWAKEEKKFKRNLIKNIRGKTHSLRKKLLVDRIRIARDIASALTYLHNNSVIHRDLKPDNLGFDIRGDIKLFDFGLAKEVPSSMDMNEQTYLMSGAGSLRYMAPEVVLQKPYNMKADVYSFSLLLYEILSLKISFYGFSVDKLMQCVVLDECRPKLNFGCPDAVRDIIDMGWSNCLSERPTMAIVHNVLRYHTEDISNVDSADSRRPRKKRRSEGSIGTSASIFRRLSNLSVLTDEST